MSTWSWLMLMWLSFFFGSEFAGHKPALEPTDLHLYGMDYPVEEHHKQIYVIAPSELAAVRSAEAEGIKVSSVRRVDVPILATGRVE